MYSIKANTGGIIRGLYIASCKGHTYVAEIRAPDDESLIAKDDR